jgi:hypothetical protein
MDGILALRSGENQRIQAIISLLSTRTASGQRRQQMLASLNRSMGSTTRKHGRSRTALQRTLPPSRRAFGAICETDFLTVRPRYRISGMKRPILAGLAILIAWTVIDLPMHRFFLAPLYEDNASMWRPFDQLNVGLIYVVILALIAIFVATYTLLIRPKSLRAGLAFGALLGLALGISAGFGTYIHMPIPLLLAAGWLIGGWLKGVAAGAILGSLIADSRGHE